MRVFSFIFFVRQNLYVLSLFRNPDQDDRIFNFWLFTSINVCRAGWWRPCLFPVCRWFEWPSSGVAGFYDHKPSWSCILWLRNGLRLRSDGCRPISCTWWTDPLMTYIPEVVRVAVASPIGNSDHSSLPVVISMAQAVPNFYVSRKFLLKHQVNWNIQSVVQYRTCPGVTFGLQTILLWF